ncbi:MAG: hypothetical protein SV775_09960 [Thermodesulfobacteriota bacterium]|nr:hypothetical protein [Thermodesulfobacteriota bacterium]
MKKLFDDILNMKGVKGIMLLSFKGKLLLKEFTPLLPVLLEDRDWTPFVKALAGVQEADLVFENLRLYIRNSPTGYLVVLMEVLAPIAMVRLNCDILLPSLGQEDTSKGLKRLFKRKQ